MDNCSNEAPHVKRSAGEWLAHAFSVIIVGGVIRAIVYLGFLLLAAPKKLFACIRRRWAARPWRTLQDWIALTIARALSFAIVGALVYITYIVEMTSYDDFRKCNKSSTVTRLEWVLGSRPVDQCRSY
jgi:hypothetical protein